MGFYYIYFYGTEDGAEVKVGRTKQHIPARRNQHENQNGHDVPMRTLAVVLGQVSDESALKNYFKPWRSRTRSNEWFSAGEEMRGYLAWLRSQAFVARDEAELGRLHAVDASDWLPTRGRAKQPMQLRLEAADPWDDLRLDHVTEGDFYTHPSFIEAARSAMGTIDLDPASCTEANQVVKAGVFFGFRENGLLHNWRGNVWLNPPYGNWAEWTPKLLSEWHNGGIEQMCVLATTRVITAQTFHRIVDTADAMFVGCGRYVFWGPNAKAPDEGHVVFYFGADVDRFRESFAPLGTVFFHSRSSRMIEAAA